MRLRNENSWFVVSNKIKRNSGQQFQRKYKGKKGMIKDIEARKIGNPCTCKKKCFEILGEETIKNIFDEYWALGDYNLQNSYLISKMSQKDVKRRKKKDVVPQIEENVNHKRNCTFTYKLTKPVNGKPCKSLQGGFHISPRPKKG